VNVLHWWTKEQIFSFVPIVVYLFSFAVLWCVSASGRVITCSGVTVSHCVDGYKNPHHLTVQWSKIIVTVRDRTSWAPCWHVLQRAGMFYIQLPVNWVAMYTYYTRNGPNESELMFCYGQLHHVCVTSIFLPPLIKLYFMWYKNVHTFGLKGVTRFSAKKKSSFRKSHIELLVEF
jgi:hypothetical protein